MIYHLKASAKKHSSVEKEARLKISAFVKSTVMEVLRSRRLTHSLHGVSFLYKELSSGDVDVHAERLLLLVQCV